MVTLSYDCYAYFCIEYAHNTYPIRNAKNHLDEILSLQENDVIFLKGAGKLKIVRVNINKYDWKTKGELQVYEEISISCKQIQ